TAPFLSRLCAPPDPPSFPTRRSSDLAELGRVGDCEIDFALGRHSALESHPVGLGHNISMAMLREIKALLLRQCRLQIAGLADQRSEEHTSELQSRVDLVCRLLLEKKI